MPSYILVIQYTSKCQYIYHNFLISIALFYMLSCMRTCVLCVVVCVGVIVTQKQTNCSETMNIWKGGRRMPLKWLCHYGALHKLSSSHYITLALQARHKQQRRIITKPTNIAEITSGASQLLLQVCTTNVSKFSLSGRHF